MDIKNIEKHIDELIASFDPEYGADIICPGCDKPEGIEADDFKKILKERADLDWSAGWAPQTTGRYCQACGCGYGAGVVYELCCDEDEEETDED